MFIKSAGSRSHSTSTLTKLAMTMLLTYTIIIALFSQVADAQFVKCNKILCPNKPDNEPREPQTSVVKKKAKVYAE